MTSIVLKEFGGMYPRRGEQHLPASNAREAENSLLLSGELRPLYQASHIHTFGEFDTGPVKMAHRGIYSNSRQTVWIPFFHESASCVRGPLVNDKYDRYYWTVDGDNLQYAPLADLEDFPERGGYDVGVPAPDAAPTVRVFGDREPVVDRSYVYTYVTVYGEEGPPSPPTLASGSDSGTWVISGMSPGPRIQSKNWRMSRKNIYRTVTTGVGIVEYHYVATVALTDPDFVDNIPTSEVGLNYTLESEGWFPPPDGLSGLIAHPNGFLVAFNGRDLHFSDPYRPHAWDPANVLSVESPIVALGVFGTTIVVATAGHPYLCTGINPKAMVLTMHDTAEPCLSRYGLQSMPFGVYYPTTNGLLLVSPRGFMLATKSGMTREEWNGRYDIPNFRASRFNDMYLALETAESGLMFDPSESRAALVDFRLHKDWTSEVVDRSEEIVAPNNNDITRAENIFDDDVEGRAILLGDNKLYEWHPTKGPPMNYVWQSMEYDTPSPENFGAGRMIWYPQTEEPTEAQKRAWRIWSEARMRAAPLNPINFHVINGVKVIPNSDMTFNFDPEDSQEVRDLVLNYEQHKQPFAWSPLRWTTDCRYQDGVLVCDPWPYAPRVFLEVIANEKLIYRREIPHTRMFRLPHGFKATRWFFRLIGNVNIQSVKVAETGKELRSV